MMNNKPNRILVMGRPNSGKTHFGGQLYIKLTQRDGQYKATIGPSDITVIKEVVDLLNRGISADHTNVELHKELPLSIQDGSGQVIEIALPEYGGEQVNEIVKNRKINLNWKNQLENSKTWILFIRLDDLKVNDDIIQRGLPDLEELKKRSAANTVIQFSDHAFFIELLQMLSYAKNLPAIEYVTDHRLIIILSCWDLIPNASNGTKPSNILKERIPLLHQFVDSNWKKGEYEVLGLSSTEKSLHPETPDSDFLEKGPESFGYIIMPDGSKHKDLTAIIPILFEKL